MHNHSWFNWGMESKKLLAATLAELKGKTTQARIAKAIGVTQSSVGRYLRAEVAATLDTLDAMAKEFDLEPWQLICPYEALATKEGLKFVRTVNAVISPPDKKAEPPKPKSDSRSEVRAPKKQEAPIDIQSRRSAKQRTK